MRRPRYRYFIGCQPDLPLRTWLESVRAAAGQVVRPVRNLHFTLCVIAELQERDRSLRRRIEAALTDAPLSTGSLGLGQVRGGPQGAAIHSVGPQPEIQALYRALIARLAAQGIRPLHRKSGLQPHFTLGHDPCTFARFKRFRSWTPREVLLIESHVGPGVHKVLARWSLLAPLQGTLPFGPRRGGSRSVEIDPSRTTKALDHGGSEDDAG